MLNLTLETSADAILNKTVLYRYLSLPQPTGKVQATYVWVDINGGVRGKTITLEIVLPEKGSVKLADLIRWHHTDRTSPTNPVHVYLEPVAVFPDPFLRGQNVLVLCETYEDTMQPTTSNRRHHCVQIMRQVEASNPWFGIEQEFTLLGVDKRPLGWPKYGFPDQEGPYRCGVGADSVIGRDIVEAHYRACLFAGVLITGFNAEEMLSQWEYQIGPTDGVSASDHLWISRYILHRVAEDFGVIVSFHPKPIAGDWKAAGVHANFSTETMRKTGGIAKITEAIEKMSKVHNRDMQAYDPKSGKDDDGRPTCYPSFTSGVENRRVSVRIPLLCSEEKCGYLEDRRPSSNCDPYLVTETLVKTILLNE